MGGDRTAPRTGPALAAVCAVVFLTFLDTTVVSVALADIQTDLQAGVSSLQWVVNGYALVFAGAMLAAGSLGDRLGRRRVMVAGVAVFCAGSLVAALAPGVGWLVAGRAVMGLGAAASEPGTLSVIRHLYDDDRRRARALGLWAAISGLAIALGPVIGGTLVGLAGWRSVFWFNVAAAATVLVVSARVVPESVEGDRGSRDVGGFVLAVVSLSTLTFAVIDGESTGYTSAGILALFGVSALASAAFVAVELSSPVPLVDLRLVARRSFAGALAVAFAISFGLFAIFFFVALYLQLVANYSGYRIAEIFLPMAVVMMVASVLGGRWVARSGAALPMTTGCALGGAGILLTDAVLGHQGFAALSATLALAGLGLGLALAPVLAVALGSVAPQRSGMAASAANTSRELGAVFAVAVLGALVNARLTSELRGRLAHMGIPSFFQGVVINAVTHGGVPGTGNAPAGAESLYGSIVNRVISSAYTAFRDGVDASLLLAGVLVLAACPLAAWALHRRAPPGPPAASGDS